MDGALGGQGRHPHAGRHVIRALQYLGLSDAFDNTKLLLYVMNVTYPVIDSEVVEFYTGKAVLMIEEGQPEYLEQAVNTILRRRDIGTRVSDKDVLPMDGDYTAQVVMEGIRALPRLLGNRPPVPDARKVLALPEVARVKEVVPGSRRGCAPAA